jgi:hypothetical protein
MNVLISVNTGADAVIAGTKAIGGEDLGVRYSGYRDLDRFDAQIEGLNVGMISWPGGTLAETDLKSYGLEYPDLVDPASGRAGLSEMMKFAIDHDSGLSVVLPTARYANDIDGMRADVKAFMQDLLGGSYGPMPEKMIFHIGSEHYAHFQGLTPDGAASGYGHVAAEMVHEIQEALDDPKVNAHHVDIDVSVQAGRTMVEDQAIRDSFDPDTLSTVDLVMHHRYAAQAGGVDWGLKSFGPILDAWQHDVVAAGGELPETHLSEWNVASLTRNEVLNSYVRDMSAHGVHINPADVDLAGRTDTDFENYWQEALTTRDYGVAAPRLYLELFSEYQAEGLGSATIHAVDMVHAGRITFQDLHGDPVRFVGGEMINMLYESVEGTQVLDAVEGNSSKDEVWTYGFEGHDRTVVFLASDPDKAAGKIDLEIEGLNKGYAAVWVEGLTAEVPEDWMSRFGIIDNKNVDESNEGQTYAQGHREHIGFDVKGSTVSFSLDHPGEVVRVVIAHSPAEAAQIAQWAGTPDGILNNGVESDPSLHAHDGATTPLDGAGVGSLDDLLHNAGTIVHLPESGWMQDLMKDTNSNATVDNAEAANAANLPKTIMQLAAYSSDGHSDATQTITTTEPVAAVATPDSVIGGQHDLPWLSPAEDSGTEESGSDAEDHSDDDTPSTLHSTVAMAASAAASMVMGSMMMAMTQGLL